MSKTPDKSKKIVSLILGPALFVVMLLLPLNGFELSAKVAMGCVLWMG